MRIRWSERLDSTNEECFRQASSGEQKDLVVAALEQTGGRGKRGSLWVSAPGGLYFSWFAGFDPKPAFRQMVTLAAALGVRDYLLRQEVEADLKWPNDLYLEGWKICGILGEVRTLEMGDALVLGTGLNLAQECFDGVAEQGGSLLSVRGIRRDPVRELPRVLKAQGFWYDRLQASPLDVREEYLRSVRTGRDEAAEFLERIHL